MEHAGVGRLPVSQASRTSNILNLHIEGAEDKTAYSVV